jgi:hypothetical protein
MINLYLRCAKDDLNYLDANMSNNPGKNRPKVTISAAITIDGFLDTVDEERLIISSAEDMEEVHRLRARSDAILVGAETIRRDDCSLTARGDFAVGDQPLRVRWGSNAGRADCVRGWTTGRHQAALIHSLRSTG